MSVCSSVVSEDVPISIPLLEEGGREGKREREGKKERERGELGWGNGSPYLVRLP